WRTAEMIIRPAIDQPTHVGHDRPHILGFLLCRIRIIHTDVANAAELACDPKIEANRFRVTNVQVAVRLWRKTRNDLFVFSRANILSDNVANKVRRSSSLGRHGNRQKYRRRLESTTSLRSSVPYVPITPCFSEVFRDFA